METGDSHDIRGAKAVVRFLCRNGLRWYRGRRPADWEETFEAVRARFPLYTGEEEVEAVLLGEGVDGVRAGETGKRFILLAPPKSGATVCLLGARWQLSAEAVELTLYLHLFGKSQLAGQRTWHRGYRLELPHSTGVHRYPHVQPVASQGWAIRRPDPFTEQGVPTGFPAFPLWGRNLTTLCAALAIALEVGDLPGILEALKGCRTRSDVESLFG